jgi:hypothetical protein
LDAEAVSFRALRRLALTEQRAGIDEADQEIAEGEK